MPENPVKHVLGHIQPQNLSQPLRGLAQIRRHAFYRRLLRDTGQRCVDRGTRLLQQLLMSGARHQRAVGDFHRADLTDAALVACYLTPPAMAKLKPKLEAELKPGALVLCNTFAVRGWQPVAVATAPDAYRSQIYLYEVGA